MITTPSNRTVQRSTFEQHEQTAWIPRRRRYLYTQKSKISGAMKMVKVSIDIDRDLHKAIKKKAIDSDVTMKAYIVEVLRRDIEGEDN